MKLEPFVWSGLGAADMHGAGSSTTKFSFGVGGREIFRVEAPECPHSGAEHAYLFVLN